MKKEPVKRKRIDLPKPLEGESLTEYADKAAKALYLAMHPGMTSEEYDRQLQVELDAEAKRRKDKKPATDGE